MSFLLRTSRWTRASVPLWLAPLYALTWLLRWTLVLVAYRVAVLVGVVVPAARAALR